MQGQIESIILTCCAVLTLLGGGLGAFLRLCGKLREIQEQNAVQSAQLAALTRAVEQLQEWALSRALQSS
ncbi:MAG: hypothetical protein U1E53_13125 [Dongiaceae bacterium]